MNRVLLIKGEQRMRPTEQAYALNKDFWTSKGWLAAGDDVLNETMQELAEEAPAIEDEQEIEPEQKEESTRRKKKQTDQGSPIETQIV